jgi:hypothetical protein
MRSKRRKIGDNIVIYYEVYCFATKSWRREHFTRDFCVDWGKSVSSFTNKIPSEVIIASKVNPNWYFVDEDEEEIEEPEED